MKRITLFLLFVFSLSIGTALTSCTNNYSNGERVGMITSFSDRGLVWKTWEGHLNPTQTGMNSAQGIDFSVDTDGPNAEQVRAIIDSAATQGWKVKLIYHQVFGYNWFQNRGESDILVVDAQVLDRAPIDHLFGGQKGAAASAQFDTTIVSTSPRVRSTFHISAPQGRILDTVITVQDEDGNDVRVPITVDMNYTVSVRK